MLDLKQTYLSLPEEFYSHESAKSFESPKIIDLNEDLAKKLPFNLATLPKEKLADFFSGQNLPSSYQPLALCYSGHQFGHFSPRLGDGRALLLGEVEIENKSFDLQLKGSGPTEYSRRGDGKSALGPVLREYLISEYMHKVGVPTTRSLAAVATGELVHRQQHEPGGILTRVASSHIRIGTFEYFATQCEVALLQLLQYSLKRHYPQEADTKNPALKLLELVRDKQILLVSKWMSLGFIHGVLNTDNVTISGETIDYGPCAFMDTFNFNQKYSFIDKNGRYNYSNQLAITEWNLFRLAAALLPLIDKNQEKAKEMALETLNGTTEKIESSWLSLMVEKLGIQQMESSPQEFVKDFLIFLQEQKLDYTNSVRGIKNVLSTHTDSNFKSLHSRFNSLESQITTNRLNPVYIPRNHLIEELIKSAYQDDFTLFHKMKDVLSEPYNQRDNLVRYESSPTADEIVPYTFCGT